MDGWESSTCEPNNTKYNTIKAQWRPAAGALYQVASRNTERAEPCPLSHLRPPRPALKNNSTPQVFIELPFGIQYLSPIRRSTFMW